MKPLLILKTGSTFRETSLRYGDFEDWILRGLGDPNCMSLILDAKKNGPLPESVNISGVVITGSHDLVTDKHTWSVAVEGWIRRIVEQYVPVLGICYGHQLLAQAMGGKAGFLPGGPEAGTICIHKTNAGTHDMLFKELPDLFPGYSTHEQTVTMLPPGATCLAFSDAEPNHGFHAGYLAWGIQFHPEFTEEILNEYLVRMKASVHTADEIREKKECPGDPQQLGVNLLRAFLRIVETAQHSINRPV